VGLLIPLALVIGCGPPSDAEMIDDFRSSRTQYNELLRMFQEDQGLERVGDLAGIWPEDPAAVGVDTARLRRYRDLMEQLGVKSLERYFGTVLFITSSGGLVPSGYMKGYVYADKAPSPLVSDSAKPLEEGEFYRHIDGNWYLIYGSY
jgi:hypothetical protein